MAKRGGEGYRVSTGAHCHASTHRIENVRARVTQARGPRALASSLHARLRAIESKYRKYFDWNFFVAASHFETPRHRRRRRRRLLSSAFRKREREREERVYRAYLHRAAVKAINFVACALSAGGTRGNVSRSPGVPRIRAGGVMYYTGQAGILQRPAVMRDGI